MKKVFLFLTILFQLTFSFGQSCEQRLKEVINGFNNFKSCSQRAEMNKLLATATTVVNDCPVYYAEHQNEFLKAKKYVEDTYAKLGCINTATGGNNQQANSKPNSTSNNPDIPFFENQYNFEQSVNKLGGSLQNGATNLTAANMAELTNTLAKEQELLKILRGNENKYPEATKYFNEYLKEKKKRKTLGWIGIGGVVVGAAAIIIGVSPALKSSSSGEEINNGLFYGGVAVAVAGLGVTIYSLKPSKKGKAALEKARGNITLGSTKNGIGLALNF